MRAHSILFALVSVWPGRAPAAEHVSAPDPLLWTHTDERAIGSLVGARHTRLYLNQGHRPLDTAGPLPLPSAAVVYAARMAIGARTIEARIGPSDRAEAVDSPVTSFSLIQERGGVSLALAHLPPGQLVRVEIDTVERREPPRACEIEPPPELLVDGARYFLFTGPASSAPPESGSQIVFLLDRSGSTATGDGYTTRLHNMKSMLREQLTRLYTTDQFTIIAFDDQVDALSLSMLPATDENRERARHFLDGIDSRGGTALFPALQRALASFAPGVKRAIVLYTDGIPMDAPASLALIQKAKTRVLTPFESDQGLRFFDAVKLANQMLPSFVDPRLDGYWFDAYDLERWQRSPRCPIVTLGRSRGGVPASVDHTTTARVRATQGIPIAPLWARARMKHLRSAAQEKLALAHHLLTSRTRFFADAD